MDIRELFLTPSYKITVFNAPNDWTNYAIRYGSLCKGNGTSIKYSVNEFLNNKNIEKISDEKHKMLGKLSNLQQAELENPHDKIRELLRYENWQHPENRTWIIIPKPFKKPTGKKIDMEFSVCVKDFKHIYEDVILPVYMGSLTKKSKSLTFSLEIPDYIYDFLMTHPEIDKRPISKIIKAERISDLHRSISNLSANAILLASLDKELESTTKVLVVDFKSSETKMRDEWNWGYTGNKISISFKFYVGQKSSSGTIYVRKKWENGAFVDVKDRMAKIGVEKYGDIIEWTQEREDFLTKIETNFSELSINLSKYLLDLNTEKLDHLISNNNLKMLS